MPRFAVELLRAVGPLAIEAALHAERQHLEQQREQRRIAALELEEARYEAELAERRYAACDPDYRLIAAQLEQSWEAALQRAQACEARLAALDQPHPVAAVTPECRPRRGSRGGLALLSAAKSGLLVIF